jgi:hypothetical protein
MKRATGTALAAVLFAAVLSLAWAAASVVSSTDDGRVPGGRAVSRAPTRIRNATPLWDGDVFSVVRPNEELPPYLFSSAAGPSGGWAQPHSNTDPNVQGVTVVGDPLGLHSSARPDRVRRVLKLTADERLSFDGYVRTQIRSPALLGAGQDRWVVVEVFIPRGTPTMSGRPGAFWTILSIFGPPYRGSGPDSFHLRRNRAGTGNEIAWDLPDGAPIWHVPATQGVWHIIARHIHLDPDPAKGFSEVWYSQRARNGMPLGPLTRQRLGGVDGVPRTRRRYYSSLDPAHNWDGSTANSVNLVNYHRAGMWPGRRYTSLYFARHRVYDGATPPAEIDPYYTGLR